MKETPVRMQDIARRAGVARSTVSMAMRNHPSIPLATRKRIQALAREMDYRPNPLVSALMTTLSASRKKIHQETLGFVSAYPKGAWERKVPMYTRLKTALWTHAETLGFHVDEFDLADFDMSPERIVKVLKARNILGLLVSPLPGTTSHLALPWEDFAAAAIGYSLTDPALHRAAHHHHHGIRCAVDHLCRLGYRSIGLAIDSFSHRGVDRNWVAGFLSKKVDCEGAIKMPLLLTDTWDERTFVKWFERERPEAVISVFPGGVISWLQNAGFAVPEDVGFVALDWSEKMQCAGIDQNFELVAAATVDLLVEQLYHNRIGVPSNPKTVLIEGRWTDGSTVRNVRDSVAYHRSRSQNTSPGSRGVSARVRPET